MEHDTAMLGKERQAAGRGIQGVGAGYGCRVWVQSVATGCSEVRDHARPLDSARPLDRTAQHSLAARRIYGKQTVH